MWGENPAREIEDFAMTLKIELSGENSHRSRRQSAGARALCGRLRAAHNHDFEIPSDMPVPTGLMPVVFETNLAVSVLV